MMNTDHSRLFVPYAPDDVARYRAAGLWGRCTIPQEFHAVAEAHPKQDALITSAGRISYRELDLRSDQLAAGLAALGLVPGDPVLFQVTNHLDSVLAWYGTLKAGLVPVCALASHRGHEIGEISRRAGAVAHLVDAGTTFDLVSFAHEQARGHPTLRHVLTLGADTSTPDPRIEDLGTDLAAGDARKIVERIQKAIDPDDIAVFQLSGGTTGIPKLIPRLHAEYWYNARAYANAWNWDATTRNGHLIPIIHNAGIVCGVHGPHSVGACLVLSSPDLAEALPLLTEEKATDVLLGHGHYSAVEHPAFETLAMSLRTVVLSGAKVPSTLFSRLEDLGVWAGQLFGMGEGFFAVTRPGSPRAARAATVGTSLSPLDEIHILEPGSERELPDGEVGELCCTGPYTLRGYFNAAEHNATAFTTDGLYRTGDLASLTMIEGERYLSIEGRIKDVINRGGEKINAEEVELLLLKHPAVAAAAVIAMPDERLGERTCACLVPVERPISLADVQQHLTQLGVAKFKWPERLEWLDELPKTLVGKINKKSMRAEIAARLRAEHQQEHP